MHHTHTYAHTHACTYICSHAHTLRVVVLLQRFQDTPSRFRSYHLPIIYLLDCFFCLFLHQVTDQNRDTCTYMCVHSHARGKKPKWDDFMALFFIQFLDMLSELGPFPLTSTHRHTHTHSNTHTHCGLCVLCESSLPV